MLTTIIIDKRIQNTRSLAERLRLSGLRVIEAEGISDPSCEHCVLSDSVILEYTEEGALCALKQGCATAVFLDDTNKASSFSGVKYLLTDFDGISRSFFELVYARYHKLPVTIAETDRLFLIELSKQDMEAFHELVKVVPVDVVPYIPRDDDEAFRSWFNSYIDTKYSYFGYGYYGLFEKLTGELVGTCGLEESVLSEEAGECFLELGYMMAPRFRRRGYASEGIAALMKYAADELEQTELLARIDISNEVSVKTLISAGRQLCGDCKIVIAEGIGDDSDARRSGDKEIEVYRIILR